jgi:hypothetical protein
MYQLQAEKKLGIDSPHFLHVPASWQQKHVVCLAMGVSGSQVLFT